MINILSLEKVMLQYLLRLSTVLGVIELVTGPIHEQARRAVNALPSYGITVDVLYSLIFQREIYLLREYCH
jgi:hypothetical protein